MAYPFTTKQSGNWSNPLVWHTTSSALTAGATKVISGGASLYDEYAATTQIMIVGGGLYTVSSVTVAGADLEIEVTVAPPAGTHTIYATELPYYDGGAETDATIITHAINLDVDTSLLAVLNVGGLLSSSNSSHLNCDSIAVADEIEISDIFVGTGYDGGTYAAFSCSDPVGGTIHLTNLSGAFRLESFYCETIFNVSGETAIQRATASNYPARIVAESALVVNEVEAYAEIAITFDSGNWPISIGNVTLSGSSYLKSEGGVLTITGSINDNSSSSTVISGQLGGSFTLVQSQTLACFLQDAVFRIHGDLAYGGVPTNAEFELQSRDASLEYTLNGGSGTVTYDGPSGGHSRSGFGSAF